jgi:hypothetical protein
MPGGHRGPRDLRKGPDLYVTTTAIDAAAASAVTLELPPGVVPGGDIGASAVNPA